VLELQRRKKDLIEEIVQPGETTLTSLTEDDIRELLDMRPGRGEGARPI